MKQAAAVANGGGLVPTPCATTGDEDLGLRFRLVAFDCLDSTNDEARRRADAGATAGTVVWARRQESGRGRRGRAWISPGGNLYCSIILRPACPLAIAAQLSLVTAVAVADAVARWLPEGPTPQVKWPNDVLVGGAKIAGILLESSPGMDGRLDWVVVGAGINIAGFPAETEFPATALMGRVGGALPEVEAVLTGLLSVFSRWYQAWVRGGFDPIREAWLERAAGLGGPVTVRLDDRSFSGTLTGLDADGALLLAPDGGGPIRRVAAGDVFFGPSRPVEA